MNYILKKIIIIFFFLSLPVSAYSNEFIAYLDIDFIFKNSNLGKQIVLNLNEENKKNLLQLKNKENELKKIEKDLTNKKKFLTDEEFKKNLDEFNSNIKLFRQNKNELVGSFEKKKNDQINDFFKKINPILEEYMTENSIKIIIDKKNVLIAKEKLDITDNILNLINEKLN